MEYLKLLHGLYNTTVMVLFIRQGRLGFRIRRERVAGLPSPVMAIKRHRQAGPILAAMALLGFLAGSALAYIDHGHILHHPLHFATGATLIFSIDATYLVSRNIKGPASAWRTVHYYVGIFILMLYPVQVCLGLGIFF